MPNEPECPAAHRASTPAPTGQVYVCTACGKVSRWRYGLDDQEHHDATPGWDESCMLHAVLIEEAKIVEPEGWRYPMRVRRTI